MDQLDNQIFFEANKSLWNEKTKFHEDSDFYDMPSFLDGKNSLQTIELEALGDIRGKKILHLQCHFGQDSLSMARMGAEVTAIDFSSEAIQLAKKLNKQLGLSVNFIEGNVYEAADLIHETFDIVFTSYGVIAWLPNLNSWAEIIHQMLKPNGYFYIVEFHPLFYIFDDNKEVKYPYFNTGKVFKEIVQGTYADPNADLAQEEYFWCHSLEEVIRPFIKLNMVIEDFREFDFSPYNCFPNLEENERGKFALNFPFKLPHVFSLKARKTYT
jgi:2-polyprenyl-3-methyl-5-hydroxy-6-metoxy-1,4-benzoquinol methylase